jgi:molybdopterin synthase catalytic subunit
MQVCSVVGPGASSLVERLAGAFDGRVATVERLPGTPGKDHPSAAAAYGLAESGAWMAAGDDRSLDDVLDELTPRYDVALLAGFADARVPTVRLGDAETRGEVIHDAPDAESVDERDVLGALADTDPRVTLESLVREAKATESADRAGAIATFTGRVRAKDDDDDARTTHLEFETYEGVAEERMRAIEGELADRDGVFDVRMFHRTGVIPDGEDIVFVVVLAGHREEAFRTVEDGINRLKDEVPIFKKERTVDEEFWVHERE